MVIDIQGKAAAAEEEGKTCLRREVELMGFAEALPLYTLSLIHISEPTRPY